MQEESRLVELYKLLWNNRSMEFIDGGDQKEVLEQAIRRELKDELTHPRTRKQPMDKYYLAVKRIVESKLNATEQILLIKEFTLVLEEIKKES
ncbi:hypothetical protein ACQCU1_07475 [Sutcliffiella horikoshii]|uniref:Uncharacterized protein n=1 Tax=Sutcliffiella horikoshii TaxID=79883 RepID=A0A1Y0CKT1_9BACI|nr:hypothetical protein [Sutcliffiella horikoshii]ART75546.1 hypothetical protein B4U37_05665 [Sutcliffiella horikoshii]TYS60828.1 hypothetical protein FZC74_00660 [Sutcliffiella horikoshii]